LPRRLGGGKSMELVIVLLLLGSHFVTFLLGYSFGAHVWSIHHRGR
jgi:hypothetical protein